MPQRPPYALPPLLLLLLLTGLSAGLLPSAPAHAADNGNWSVQPAGPGSRPYFYLSADPGQTITDRVAVANKSAVPRTFRLYAADAYNTARDGGFAVRSPDERRRGVGAWAKLEHTRVTVPPGRSVTVPYTLTVPRSAEPGDHPGALVALDERVSPARGEVAVGIRQAVGARVYLRVNGSAVPGLSVEDVRISQHRPLVPGLGRSRAAITYTLHNRGNVTLTPRVTLRATGLFGRTLLDRRLHKVPTELLPHQRIRLTEHWPDSPQLDWGDIHLTATTPALRASATTSFLALPWLPTALLLTTAALWTRTLHRKHRLATHPPSP